LHHPIPESDALGQLCLLNEYRLAGSISKATQEFAGTAAAQANCGHTGAFGAAVVVVTGGLVVVVTGGLVVVVTGGFVVVVTGGLVVVVTGGLVVVVGSRGFEVVVGDAAPLRVVPLTSSPPRLARKPPTA
jgi:hypothetical protein